MKKQILPITLLLLSLFCLTATADAQTVACVPNSSITAPGIYQNNLYCFPQGSWVSYVWQFKNFDAITALGQTVHVDSMRIDSIINLPCGIKWTTNKESHDTANNNKFVKLENGCIWIFGTATDSIGSYNTDAYATAWVHGLGAIPQHLGTIGSYIRTRVVAQNATTCTPPDTSGFVTPACSVVRNSYTTANSGIGEISQTLDNLTNYPNPFGNTTEIMFTTSEIENVTLRVFDLVGKTLHEESLVAVPGKNTVTFNRKGMTNGIYFYSISNGKHAVTSKMVIAE